MRTLSALTLAVLVLAGCLSFALPSLAGTPNSIRSAMVSEYEQHVPEHLRSLVTRERYESVRASLDDLRGRYFGQGLLDIHMISVVAASPCSDSLAFLLDQFYTNPVVPKALDAAVAGQVEGGLVQGIGWLTSEQLTYAPDGRLLNDSLANYKPPEIHAAPEIQVSFLPQADEPHGLLQAKAVGEPPFLYGIGAWSALQQAMHAYKPDLTAPVDAPLTPEQVLMALYPDA